MLQMPFSKVTLQVPGNRNANPAAQGLTLEALSVLAFLKDVRETQVACQTRTPGGTIKGESALMSHPCTERGEENMREDKEAAGAGGRTDEEQRGKGSRKEWRKRGSHD